MCSIQPSSCVRALFSIVKRSDLHKRLLVQVGVEDPSVSHEHLPQNLERWIRKPIDLKERRDTDYELHATFTSQAEEAYVDCNPFEDLLLLRFFSLPSKILVLEL